ncbi:MAG TPA: alkaline phosphatase family protein [Terriglobales bacterium]|nr:alkaline phosphatase family protein [Terriglobales bacterium]
MRSSTKLLLTLFFFGVALAPAQTIPAGTFKHIIIIVQENRTPDNLFGAAPRIGGCSQEDPFEPGVDIENGGYVKGTQQPICNASLPMNMGLQFDPGHLNGDWVDDYDSGHMDGFCDRYAPPTYCPTYSYVQKSDVQPYFDIATGYGFANYMFQTNQGPSFPAHQFLFTGTSAPVAPKDPNNYYLDFIADNAGFTDSGCPYDGIANGWPGWVIPNGTPEEDPRTNKSECYTHDSLVTNTNGDKGKSWRYYTPTTGIIWDAPAGIPEVCYGHNQDDHGPCTAHEFTDHVKLPTQQNGAPIFDDIANCTLQQISWVIPDHRWSDHPQSDGTVSPPLGPSWVGDIVDAVGSSYQNSLGNCDYWGHPAHSGTTPEPTAIFVVWLLRPRSPACRLRGYGDNVSHHRSAEWLGLRLRLRVPGAAARGFRVHQSGLRLGRLHRELPKQGFPLRARFRKHSGVYGIQLRDAQHRPERRRRICGLQRARLVHRP